MSALTRLRDHGLQLHISGEQLIVAPRWALTDELRALIRAQKRNILSELAGQNDYKRASRQAGVEAELRAHPERRVAFDVADAPADSESGEPVSVVLAARHGEHILSGELFIPRERWNMALFVRTLDSDSTRAS